PTAYSTASELMGVRPRPGPGPASPVEPLPAASARPRRGAVPFPVLETGPGDGGSAWARAGPAESPVDALGRLGAVVSASRPFSARRERGATPGSPREGAAEGSRARPFPVSVARGRRCTSGRTTERPP